MLFAFSYWRVHHGLSVLGLNSSPLHMLVAVEVPLIARKGAFFFLGKANKYSHLHLHVHLK